MLSRNERGYFEEINETKESIADKTTEIKEPRRELKVCGQIRERSARVVENLTIIDSDRKREKER